MSNPEKSATQSEQPAPADSLAQKVQATMALSSYDETTGKVILPDDVKESLDEDTLFAVTAEHRRRNTQAGYTKGQQTIKALEAERAELLRQLETRTAVSLSPEDRDKLEELKDTDPDAWRVEMNRLENEAKEKSRAELGELTGKAREAAEQTFELSRRQQVLSAFNESAEVAITEELLANEVPPRITNKLTSNEISFEEFLSEVEKYVTTGKAVENPKVLNQPNIGNMAGGKTPKDMKPEKSLSATYAEAIY